MKLDLQELKNVKQWEEAGFKLPRYDIEEMRERTLRAPEWVHLGAGNIFRAFPARICQELINKGLMDTGIIAAEGYDYELCDKVLKPFDNLTAAVTLKADGTIEKEIVASISAALRADMKFREDWELLENAFKAKSLKMVSFTITEKGYSVAGNKDIEKRPVDAESYIGKVAYLCYLRFKEGHPLTLVSMDNCSHNGDVLKNALMLYVNSWCGLGYVEKEFSEYMESSVSYPWTMIDKITPRPSDEVAAMLEECGFESTQTVITEKNTYAASFVNAEEAEYLIIEDDFKNGRLPLDRAGVIYTDRETVDKVEKMKVCTCLNPLHSALAVFGCISGYNRISEEMKDTDLVKLIKGIGYKEGLPVVTDPKILSPKGFIDEVINTRLPNPFIEDMPQRIACDTSQKMGVRFGETIKAYAASEGLDVTKLEYIPFVIAGWCRYLMAVDDMGREFEPSPDPLLPELMGIMKRVELGNNDNANSAISKILSRSDIFGVDLYSVGLGGKIEKYFHEMNEGMGAVRRTLVRL